MPRTKVKGEWAVKEAEALDRVCFYFPDVEVPVEVVLEPTGEQLTLGDT
jgi:hypothetical protein